MSPELLETLLRVCEEKGSGELSENDYSQSVSTAVHHDGSIPAARAIGDFAHERVGGDLVLFDAETMQYHTLNAVAEQIWRSCDGIAGIEAIAASTGLPVETIETTVGELGEASLLSTPAETWSVPMTRRRVAKLLAAGAVGAPVVLSITAPHASAQTSDCVSVQQPCSCDAIGSLAPICFHTTNAVCCDTRDSRYGIWYWDAGTVDRSWNCNEPDC